MIIRRMRTYAQFQNVSFETCSALWPRAFVSFSAAYRRFLASPLLADVFYWIFDG